MFPVSTLGAVYFAVHGGTGRLFFFFEAGRGGVFFFPRRDGVVFFFFFDGTGRGGVFFFFEGRDGTVVFGGGIFFWRDGAKSLHRPAKGGLNRPASRPCKALKINISLFAFAPENLVSRDGFGSPVPRQHAYLHNTRAEYGAYLRGSSRVPRRRPFIY